MNRKINHIHERALRLVYQDYTTSFQDLLKKDGSLTFHHRNIHQVAIEIFKGIGGGVQGQILDFLGFYML